MMTWRLFSALALLGLSVQAQDTEPGWWGGAVNVGTRCDSDVLFLLDKTQSVSGEFATMKTVLTELVDLMSLGPDQQAIGLIAFSGKYSRPTVRNFGELQSTEELVEFVRKLRIGTTTWFKRPLEMARDLIQGRRRQRPVTVIMISDGHYADREFLARDLRDQLVQDFDDVTTYAMDVVQRPPGPGLIEVAGDLASVIGPPNIVEKARAIIGPRVQCGNRVTTTPTPRVTRRQTRRTTTTTMRPSTTTPVPVTGCEVDLVFILDFSGSVSDVYRFYVDSAISIVQAMRVDRHFTRVALVTYSSAFQARHVFHLKDFESAADVVRAIELAPYIGGVTHTWRALEVGAEELAPAVGGRPRLATQVAVLMTDGFSQKADPSVAAAALRAGGAQLFVVATARDYEPYMEELLSIAGGRDSVFLDAEVGRLRDRILAPLNANCRGGRASPRRRL